LIEISDLHASYNGKEVLKGLGLDMKKGTFMGILGPNGCGKTTLLRCMAGSMPKWKGSISIMQKDIRDWSTRALARKMAILHQDISPGFDYTVAEVISMGRYPHLRPMQFSDPSGELAVRKAIKWTSLDGMERKRISQLSGGERQRVFIARAFAQDTDILLLDEATKNLDIRHSIDIMDLIRRRNLRKGITTISILHDIDLAARVCDEIALMRSGRILVRGPVKKVLTEKWIERTFDIEVRITHENGFHIRVEG